MKFQKIRNKFLLTLKTTTKTVRVVLRSVKIRIFQNLSIVGHHITFGPAQSTLIVSVILVPFLAEYYFTTDKK